MQTATNNSQQVLVLKVWKSYGGVPSVDPNCIEIMTLMKMNNIVFEVKYSRIPQFNSIPSLQYGDTVATNETLIQQNIAKFSTKNVDSNLDSKGLNRLYVYKKYFRDTYLPAFYHEVWLKDANSEHSIKAWFNFIIPFPLNRLYLRKSKNFYFNFCYNKASTQELSEFNTEMYRDALKCLEDFELLLKDGRHYLLGSTPTSLDALVYAYLLITLNMQLPDGQLKNSLQNLELLTRFVGRISQKFYPDMIPKEISPEPPAKQNEDLSSTSIVFAGIFAMSVMIWYASLQS